MVKFTTLWIRLATNRSIVFFQNVTAVRKRFPELLSSDIPINSLFTFSLCIQLYFPPGLISVLDSFANVFRWFWFILMSTSFVAFVIVHSFTQPRCSRIAAACIRPWNGQHFAMLIIHLQHIASKFVIYSMSTYFFLFMRDAHFIPSLLFSPITRLIQYIQILQMIHTQQSSEYVTNVMHHHKKILNPIHDEYKFVYKHQTNTIVFIWIALDSHYSVMKIIFVFHFGQNHGLDML